MNPAASPQTTTRSAYVRFNGNTGSTAPFASPSEKSSGNNPCWRRFSTNNENDSFRPRRSPDPCTADVNSPRPTFTQLFFGNTHPYPAIPCALMNK